ncbi:Poly A polymerase, head domain containing protein [Parasponia andersonii]|uniref:Poly A polymerase, head domain containing protein n=1 Tax=Parasponia andersonii TaxID=3476 RepID=A0A2P5B9K4_PARAD|nr:Poly A polymerase, head domain containing protein [Parasponia andersonii]
MAVVASSSPPSVQVREKIELTDIEKKIFDRLLGTLRHFGLQNQLRVAGGWVRDKLLGKDCYDIDIALDNMLGSEFVEKVTQYLLSVGEEAQGIAIIPSNPDQSKHLETARMRICDMWIDFVNLRCEEYSDNSRIPTKQKYGTAEEDAYRRDLTINSLFYNINTNLVEDYTKRGIEDLKSGKIVTPLPAKATFMDDPLRVLRAIRFGARFEFILDEELKEAASCDDVKAALAAKISRERIGTEVDLMIPGNQPVKAMTYICDLKLFWVVFSLPPKIEPAEPEGCDRLSIAYLDATWNLIQLVGYASFSVSGKSTKNGSSWMDEQRRLSLYAAMFLPLRETTYKDNKSKKNPVVNFIFRDSLKRKVSDAETVINIHHALKKFLLLLPSLASNEDFQLTEVDWASELVDIPVHSKLRVLTGFLLREVKGFWRVALLMSTLLYEINSTEDLLNKNFQLDKLKDTFKAAENTVTQLGLEKAWDVKPLVNGKEIMNVLELKSGGPLVREWQQKLLAWQLANPSRSAEECLEWMKQTHSKRLKMT